MSDGELLRQFAADHSQAAFAELVRRHGRLVWTVCRHLSRSEAEADDAFQATFLVLLRSARKIRDAAKLTAWLYGVAYKVCVKARHSAKRRMSREQTVAARERKGGVVPDSAWDRALAAVHEEVAKLPDTLRVPFVLCCLEGRGVTEAATQLGWKLGTFSGRLSRAKDMVLARLDARGLTLGAIAGIGLAAPPTTAVAKATALAQVGFVVPDSILQLTQGVIGMSRNSATVLAAAVVLACGLGLSVGSGWMAAADARPPTADRIENKPLPRATAYRLPRATAPAPKPKPPEGVIFVSRLSHEEPDKLVEVFDTDGTSRDYLKLGKLLNVRQLRVSPNGKQLAFIRFIPLNGNQKGQYAYPEDVYIVDLEAKEPPAEPVLKGLVDPTIAWSTDGKSLYVSCIPKDTDASQKAMTGKIIPVKTFRFDLAARTEKLLDLPEGHAVLDVSPDGKLLLTRTLWWSSDVILYNTCVAPLDTLKPKAISEEDDGFAYARFAPDGTRIAGVRVKYTKSKELGLFICGLAKGPIDRVPLPKDVVSGKHQLAGVGGRTRSGWRLLCAARLSPGRGATCRCGRSAGSSGRGSAHYRSGSHGRQRQNDPRIRGQRLALPHRMGQCHSPRRGEAGTRAGAPLTGRLAAPLGAKKRRGFCRVGRVLKAHRFARARSGPKPRLPVRNRADFGLVETACRQNPPVSRLKPNYTCYNSVT